MKKLNLAVSVVVFAAVLVATGCRKPKIDSTYRSTMPPPPTPGLQVAPPPTPVSEGISAQWGTLEQPLPPRAGTIQPVSDRRWDGVVVYFAYDSAAIGPAERPKLETLAKHLGEFPTYCVVVEGHCDERGSDEYNRALGESRALAVRDYLANLGVGGTRLDTVSYGEERPAVSGNKEAGYSKNRRAEFVIGIRK